jgi:MIP family channel proteins
MNVRAIIAELLGTFTLVGVGSLSILAASAGQSPGILVAPFGFGLALMAGIVMFGHVSGAHFNPAVTLAAWIDRRVGWADAIGYVVAQVIGALIASLMILILFSKEVVDATRNVPNSVVTDPQAFAMEVLFTTVFVTVILTVTRRSPTQATFVIPLTLLLIHFTGIPLTGASVNPVRSLGPAIVVGNYEHLWVYLTAPLVGAILAWGLYRVMTPPDDEVSVEIEYDADDFDDAADAADAADEDGLEPDPLT